jgi:hypothetical protein
MIGPSTSVLVNRQPSDDDRIALRSVLDSLGPRATALSVTWASEPVSEGDDVAWLDDVARQFGFLPRSRILLAARGNTADDHRTLGEMALRCARAFGGVINLHGALEVGTRTPINLETVDDLIAQLEGNLDWAEVSKPTEAFLRAMPGRVLTVPYQTIDERTWVEHICDAEFMEAWLKHPAFHMIK